jgi:hypothetical protein
MSDALSQFTGRFCTRKPQLHPVLERLLELYSDLCKTQSFSLLLVNDLYFPVKYYDEVIANQMIISAILFVEGTFIEPRIMGPDVELNKHATMLPNFVRNISGMSGFYALGNFTKDDHPGSVKYIQVSYPPLSL